MTTRAMLTVPFLGALAAASLAASPARNDSYAATAYGGATLSRAYHQCTGSYASEAEIGRCLEAEADRQEAALNVAYRRRMAALPAPRREALRGSERAWVKQRERRCEQAYRDMEGGNGAGKARLSCLANAAITRTRWTQAFR